MIEVRRAVKASAEDVFAVLSDGWSYPSWVVGAARMRAVDEGFPSAGTRLHHSVGAWPVLLHDSTHVMECEPPHRLRLTARGWPLGEAEVDLLIEPHPKGCLVRMREDASRGPGRFVPKPLRVAAIAPRNVETLRRLAFLAERRTAEPQ